MSGLHVLWSSNVLIWAVFSDARLWNTVCVCVYIYISIYIYIYIYPFRTGVQQINTINVKARHDWIMFLIPVYIHFPWTGFSVPLQSGTFNWAFRLDSTQFALVCLPHRFGLFVGSKVLRCWMPIRRGSGLRESFPGSRSEIQRPTSSILLRKTFSWRAICVILEFLANLQKTAFLRTIANYHSGRITMKIHHR